MAAKTLQSLGTAQPVGKLSRHQQIQENYRNRNNNNDGRDPTQGPSPQMAAAGFDGPQSIIDESGRRVLNPDWVLHNVAQIGENYTPGATFLPVSAGQTAVPAPNFYGLDQVAAARGMLPQLSLQRYPLAMVRVPMTPEQQATSNLAGQLISGEVGEYRNLLEGDTDLADLAYLQSLTKSEYENFFQPSLGTLGSAGPYGEGYNSGAMLRLDQQAANDLMTQQARERFEYQEAAKDRSLQAASVLPAVADVQFRELDNRIANAERMAETHFANQELEYNEFMGNITAWDQALRMIGQLIGQEQFNAQFMLTQEAGNADRDLAAQTTNQSGFLDANKLSLTADTAVTNYYLDEWGRQLAQRELDIAEQAAEDARSGGLGNLFGTVAGGVAGFALGGGPAGALLGAQIGGGFGQAAAGGGTGALTDSLLSAPMNYFLLSQLDFGRGTDTGGGDFFTAPELTLSNPALAPNSGSLSGGMYSSIPGLNTLYGGAGVPVRGPQFNYFENAGLSSLYGNPTSGGVR